MTDQPMILRKWYVAQKMPSPMPAPNFKERKRKAVTCNDMDGEMKFKVDLEDQMMLQWMIVAMIHLMKSAMTWMSGWMKHLWLQNVKLYYVNDLTTSEHLGKITEAYNEQLWSLHGDDFFPDETEADRGNKKETEPVQGNESNAENHGDGQEDEETDEVQSDEANMANNDDDQLSEGVQGNEANEANEANADEHGNDDEEQPKW